MLDAATAAGRSSRWAQSPPAKQPLTLDIGRYMPIFGLCRNSIIRLERDRRIRIDERIAADSPAWAETGLRFAGPVEVQLEAQKSGANVIVRGRFHARVETEAAAAWPACSWTWTSRFR